MSEQPLPDVRAISTAVDNLAAQNTQVLEQQRREGSLLVQNLQSAQQSAQQTHAAQQQQPDPYCPTERDTAHLRYLENCCQALHNENIAVRQFAEQQAAQHQLARTEVLKLTNGEPSRVPPASGHPEDLVSSLAGPLIALPLFPPACSGGPIWSAGGRPAAAAIDARRHVSGSAGPMRACGDAPAAASIDARRHVSGSASFLR